MYDEIAQVFSGLVEIDSPSLQEGHMANQIKKLFGDIGIGLVEDTSRNVTGSDSGNLYAYIPGTLPGKTILFAAHMDTVMPANGKKAMFHPDGKVTSAGDTVLGADDLAAVTAIYAAVKYLKENHNAHYNLELLFTTGEELYCKGAKAFDYSLLKATSAYVPDLGGCIGTAAYAAPTILSFEAVIKGRASHAGFAPESGINAIAAGADAVATLRQGKIDEDTTANIGTIKGGDGINIVSSECVITGEIRSLHHEKAQEVLADYRQQFEQSAEKFGAIVLWKSNEDIRAYETELDSETVRAYRKAAGKAGVEAYFQKTFGGSDNNVFAQHGIEGIVIASSMHHAHTCGEYTDLHEIETVSQILIQLATEEA